MRSDNPALCGRGLTRIDQSAPARRYRGNAMRQRRPRMRSGGAGRGRERRAGGILGGIVEILGNFGGNCGDFGQPMAELHLFGQIESGCGFSERRLFCKWGLHPSVPTDVPTDVPSVPTDVPTDVPSVPTDVPTDVPLSPGWPKLLLEVWHVDAWGRRGLAGYGVCAVPSAPGCHRVTCVTWRPRGTRRQRLLGPGAPELRDPAGAAAGAAERFRLRTEAAGTVRLRLGVLPRHMARFGVAL
uniref:LOW QUALITY PROTEIN: B9 domain-containing protein 2 n=1 Tax=Lonchura striata TaxID=40157 RepID=UPI001293F9AE|nr:LOW QUALITY PROTEIN: B9 domain-containing protein 2 [Lonchura striata domestica]